MWMAVISYLLSIKTFHLSFVHITPVCMVANCIFNIMHGDQGWVSNIQKGISDGIVTETSF